MRAISFFSWRVIQSKSDLATYVVSALSIASLLAPRADAKTIVSVDGHNGGAAISASFQIMQATWTETSGYFDATITANLDPGRDANGFPGVGSGVAYLTTQNGPGTTAANEVAETSFTFPSGTAVTKTLFTGLTLQPSTSYFLTLTSTGGTSGGWSGVSPNINAVITTDIGVTRPVDYVSSSGSINAYAPASTFSPSSTAYLVFNVTGVPEPSATGLLGLGFAVAARRRRHVG
jgi:hypothetical protein